MSRKQKDTYPGNIHTLSLWGESTCVCTHERITTEENAIGSFDIPVKKLEKS